MEWIQIVIARNKFKVCKRAPSAYKSSLACLFQLDFYSSLVEVQFHL